MSARGPRATSPQHDSKLTTANMITTICKMAGMGVRMLCLAPPIKWAASSQTYMRPAEWLGHLFPMHLNSWRWAPVHKLPAAPLAWQAVPALPCVSTARPRVRNPGLCTSAKVRSSTTTPYPLLCSNVTEHSLPTTNLIVRSLPGATTRNVCRA